MFRTLKFTAAVLTTAFLLPGLASAQGFFSPFGCANGRCGTTNYRANPYSSAQYGNQTYVNQGIAAGGCYGGSCPVNYGTNAPCAQHGIVGCQQCQNGVCRQVPCAQHGVVNCPQCQGGLNQQRPLQYNFSGFTGQAYQPTQYQPAQVPPTSNPYLQPLGSSYGTGRVQTTPTYGNSTVTLY